MQEECLMEIPTKDNQRQRRRIAKRRLTKNLKKLWKARVNDLDSFVLKRCDKQNTGRTRLFNGMVSQKNYILEL